MPITPSRGTVDVLPAETPRWRQLEEAAHRIAQLFGYKEIRTPAFEPTELFTSSLGECSDIMEKELYTFRDRSGRSLTLRPELTVPVVRAYHEHNLGNQFQLKAYHIGELWRYERSQSGRTREGHQFDVEAIGSSSSSLDAELIDLAMTYLEALGLTALRLEVNSVGCKKCRPAYQQVLRDFFLGKDDVLCQDCERIKERNPMHILDCRKDTCITVTNTTPTIFQTLCPDCRNCFSTLKEHLGQMGYTVNGNPRIVQGPGYYTRNVWQIVSPHLGPSNPLCSGGCYDELVGQLGSNGAPAAGLAVGLERAIAAMEKESIKPPDIPPIDVFMVGTGEEAERIMTLTLHLLRKRGHRVERDYVGRSLKNQLKSAEKLAPLYTVVVGEEETRVTQVSVHDTARGTQENVAVGRLVDALEYRLRRQTRERGRVADQGREPSTGRARGRGREEEPERGVRDEAERPVQSDRDRTGRTRGTADYRAPADESAARFNEWAATYSEAARASVPRPPRRTPLSESALTGSYTAYPARFAWAAAQQGLLRPVQQVGRWPQAPVPLSEALPISLNSVPTGVRTASDNGSWLVEELAAPPTQTALSTHEHANDDDDGDEDDGALVSVASGDDKGEHRRRGARRGGRRHARKRSRKS